MSLRAISWALDVEGLPPVAKLILLSMADHANEDDLCWPSYTTLARRSGVHPDTVKGHVRLLREKGYVVRQERFDDLSGRQRSNSYEIKVGFRGFEQDETPPQGESPRVMGGRITPPHYIEPTSSEPKPNSIVGSSRTDVDAGSVDRVWARHLKARAGHFTAKNGKPGRMPDLTPELRKAIREAIRRHGEDKAMGAGVGIFYSEFHTGRDPQHLGKEHLDPALCWRITMKRNAVEEFYRFYEDAERAFGGDT